MNEGKGWTLMLISAYRNGAISKELFIDICIKNEWEPKFLENGDIFINIDNIRGNKMTDDKKKNESVIEKLWKKTIFPDMIKDKKEEREFLKAIKKQAKKEALEELASDGTLKNQIKQKELDKMSGKKGKDIMSKLAKGFGHDPDDKSQNKSSFADKIGRNLGFDNSSSGSSGSNSFEDKIAKGFGIGNSSKKDNENKKESAEDKILRMMR